jgi:hypothetical protein
MLAGVTGEPCAQPDSSVDVQEIHFDAVVRSSNAKAAGPGTFTTEWDFSDADPWHIVVENGVARAVHGSAPNPDLTLRTDWPEWISISMDRKNPMRSITSRRLKPWGSPRALNTFRKVFGPAGN